MGRHYKRDWSWEEYHEWKDRYDLEQTIHATADEVDGPRLSMVPATEVAATVAWPTDLIPTAAEGPDAVATGFDGVPLEESRNRAAGWSAVRQRIFLNYLAETGSVHLSAQAARLSARSAYMLRVRSQPFAQAWDTAQQVAVGRLSALAFDRAINGRTEQVYQDGALVAERRVPNDRLLMWLLARLDPRRFALPWEQRGDGDPQADALARFPDLLTGLEDHTPAE